MSGLMNWDRRIVSEEELNEFKVPPEGGTLNSLVKALLRQQIETWPMLRDAVAGFDQVEYESFNVKDSEVLTQFNPNRIVSAGAKVDAATIKQRPCFLCADNLPQEEKGIAFNSAGSKQFVVLCNPFPVLRDHLVISSRAHTPQAINGNLAELLQLTQELGEGWFTLYNGPRCGASAPDHLHFQACSSKGVPLFKDAEFFVERKNQANVTLLISNGFRLNFLAMQSSDQQALVECFDNAVSVLAEVTGATEEPMLNLVATYQDRLWTLYIFPRSKHRPDCYFAEGDKQMLVSPGAIDLAGVMVVPHPDHYARITKWDLERIYGEVTLDDAQFQTWVNRI